MKKEPGKYYKNAQAYKWLVRPKQKKMSMPEYISLMSRLYGNNDDPHLSKYYPEEERFNDKIQKQGKYEVKPKKKIKKVADSSLVSPQKPLPFNLDRFLDELHPMWWEIEYDKPLTDDEKAKLRFERLKRLAEERLMAKGIGNLLSINRYKYE